MKQTMQSLVHTANTANTANNVTANAIHEPNKATLSCVDVKSREMDPRSHEPVSAPQTKAETSAPRTASKSEKPLVVVRLPRLAQRRWKLHVLPFLFAANAAFAQQSAVQTSVNRAVDFGTRILFAIGAFLILGGIAGAAWSINNADPDGKRKAFFAIGGGLLFAMARPIVEALFEIGGGP